MKNPKNTVWRIALFLLTVVCGLLMADRGENEFPVFACSEALSGESGSTGLLLQQNMWEVVPLLGYGIVEQQGTQNPEEDETTCRTLTTEDLISEELLLPQPEETQQTALIPESVEATAGTALSNFRPAVQQVQIDRTPGALIRMGKELGIPTPYNEFTYHMIKALEEKNDGRFDYSGSEEPLLAK